jgi:hypothetical protein
MKDDFYENIERQFFMFEKKTLDDLIKSGIENHKKLLEYILKIGLLKMAM